MRYVGELLWNLVERQLDMGLTLSREVGRQPTSIKKWDISDLHGWVDRLGILGQSAEWGTVLRFQNSSESTLVQLPSDFHSGDVRLPERQTRDTDGSHVVDRVAGVVRYSDWLVYCCVHGCSNNALPSFWGMAL